jgi:tryptophan 2,3-dioxygenase
MAKSPLYYGDYLQLDSLLSAQKPKTAETGPAVHDEMLFIITHQVYELWFKQILHELDFCRGVLSADRLADAEISLVVARLHRVTEIQRVLVDQITILETMSPMDFLEFRDVLAPASGFQSFQFRLVENKLGLKVRKEYAAGGYHSRLSEPHQKTVALSEKEPSLFELVDRWLARTPFLRSDEFRFWEAYRSAVDGVLARDQAHVRGDAELTTAERDSQLKKIEMTRGNFQALFDKKRHDELVAAGNRRLSLESMQAALLITLYREQPVFQLPYRLLSVLVDIDEGFTQWRYRHALMVFRMIGTKVGTGGSSGFDYLRQTAESHRIFADLANLSSFLIPRSALPELPERFRKLLGFSYSNG